MKNNKPQIIEESITGGNGCFSVKIYRFYSEKEKTLLKTLNKARYLIFKKYNISFKTTHKISLGYVGNDFVEDKVTLRIKIMANNG